VNLHTTDKTHFLLKTTKTTVTAALREHKSPPMPKLSKGIQDSNPDFRINPDPDVCQICPEMLWMHYLVGVSHFAKYGTSRPLII